MEVAVMDDPTLMLGWPGTNSICNNEVCVIQSVFIINGDKGKGTGKI